jgi:hypothetical protein
MNAFEFYLGIAEAFAKQPDIVQVLSESSTAHATEHGQGLI